MILPSLLIVSSRAARIVDGNGGRALLVALALAISPLAASGADPESSNVDFPRFPSLSPDGSRLVFSWRGDLWMVPSDGGPAARLTAHPADDLRSAWSPDGATIVFESTRDGVRNLWLMRPDGTNVRPLTELDVPVTLSSVGRDASGGTIVTFDASRENDLYRASRPYRIPIEGGRVERVFDAFGSSTRPSSDGTKFLFDRGGASWSRRGYRGPDARDLWLFDVKDESFTQLTSWPGNDGRGWWDASGRAVYLSDAEGGVVNVFRREIDSSADAPGTPLTRFDRDARDLAVSQDGRTAVVASWNTLSKIDLSAPTPTVRGIPISAGEDTRSDLAWRRIDRDVTEGLINPDGASIAVVAYGDLFVRSLDDKSQSIRLTNTPWQERSIAWSPDGRTLYFTADESGRDEIRAATVRRTRADVKKAYERMTKKNDAPATEDGAKEESAKEEGAKPDGAKEEGAKEDGAKEDGAKEDGAKENGASASKERPSGDWADAIEFDVRTVVSGSEHARAPDPSPDGKWLAYRRGAGELVLRNLADDTERVVRGGWDTGIQWRFSPDGRWIAFQQEDRDFNSDIWIVPADGSAEPVNVTRHPDSDSDPRWSADGRILAFRSDRVNNEADVWTVWLDKTLDSRTPAELEKYFKDAADKAKKRKPLGASRPKSGASEAKGDGASKDGASKDDAANDGASKDGAAGDEPAGDSKARGADAERRTAARSEPPPVLSLDDAYLRVRRITTMPQSEGQLEMTPGGDRLVFTGESRSDPDADDEDPGRGALLSVKWDGTDQKRLGAGGSVRQITLTGDKVLALRDGRLSTVPPGGGETKNVDFAASTQIDRGDQMRRRFLAVSRALGEGFYHPTMKGLDWNALTASYLELASAARTADEFDDVAARFIGELNASHLGVSSPPDATSERRAQGRLGVRSKPVDAGFELTAIFPDGPAARSATPLQVGDVIIAVAERPADRASTLESLFVDRTGQETVVRIRRTGADGAVAELDTIVVPIGAGEQSALAYRATRLANAAEVERLSDGRIGYIHIQGMSQPSLDEFERDLYAAAEGKEGLIIDVRNNGGGWTADRLLASIMAPVHAYTVPRGADPEYRLGYPRDRLFIQRYPLPMSMLANEKSFSNAEIVAHAFKTLKRGTLVGETTHGGVISTGAVRLLDGTSVRMPFRGWYLPDGTDMENHGAVPDLRVPQTPQDESANVDAQLRRAVEELLGRLGSERKRSER